VLIRNVLRLNSYGLSEAEGGRVATMGTRRAVLDVLYLISRSTLNRSVLDASASASADPTRSRQASVTSRTAVTRSRSESVLRTSFGLLHRRMRRHQRDASSLPSRAKSLTGGR
jgi:hypothetical protein